jgi:pSer/pThr/pTyr-binding forkhead associated (FHA) protein
MPGGQSRRRIGESRPPAEAVMGERTSMGQLVILNGGFEGMTYELTSEETMIGRNPTTDITLLDEGISREHALILFDDDEGTYSIEDLQSTNGTKVNGRRVFSAELAGGDEIQIGLTRFRFERAS